LNASQVDNDSSVTGATVKLALEHLDSTKVPTTRTISTTAPLSGGGDLSTNRTLSIPKATTLVDGYLSAIDWATFNGKQGALTLTTTGTSGASTLIGNTLNIPQYAGTNIYNADGSLTAARTLTLNTFALTILGTTSSRFFATGNVGIGTTTDAGYKLDVNGTARVSGSITAGSNIIISAGAGINSQFYSTNGNPFQFGVSDAVFSANGNAAVAAITSGIKRGFNDTVNFAPTSGTATYASLYATPTINQTGGANGITRGLYIAPTLTAAADFRAIEVASGITILGASTTAKASLRIPSGTAPTSPVNGDIWFDGTDIKMRIGGVTKTFTLL
jgi:hypothetical protein